MQFHSFCRHGQFVERKARLVCFASTENDRADQPNITMNNYDLINSCVSYHVLLSTQYIPNEFMDQIYLGLILFQVEIEFIGNVFCVVSFAKNKAPMGRRNGNNSSLTLHTNAELMALIDKCGARLEQFVDLPPDIIGLYRRE